MRKIEQRDGCRPATAARSVSPGRSVAKDAIRRGDVVLDPELHAPTDRIDALLRVLPSEPKPIGQWFPVRLHHAAAEVGARIVPLGDGPIAPGAEAEVQLVLDRPIAAAAQDRFVVRDVSAQRTLGGGRFLDLRPPARKRRTPERRAQRAALAIADPTAAFAALLAAPPFAADLAVFARDRGLTAERTEALAAALDLVVLAAATKRATALAPEVWRAFAAEAVARIAAHHAENPDLQGVGREPLRMALQPRLPKPAFAVALQKLAGAGELVLDGAFVRLPSHVHSPCAGRRRRPGQRSRRCWAAKRGSARRGCATSRRRPAATRPRFGDFSSAPRAWAAPTRWRTTISFCAPPSGK